MVVGGRFAVASHPDALAGSEDAWRGDAEPTVPERRRVSRTFRLATTHAAWVYAVLIAAMLGATDFLYARWFFPPIQPTSAGTTGLENRLSWYGLHRGDYNLVFIGDSRTYCGIHPELLDPLLKTSSLNLASFANWFPTQLPLVQQLAPMVPKEATVVWSVGLETFVGSTGVQRVFPVGIVNALQYLAWGLPSTGLADNVFYYNPALYFLSMRGDIRQNFLERLDHPLQLRDMSRIVRNANAHELPQHEIVTAPDRSGTMEKQARELKEQWQQDPRVAAVEIIRDNGRPTSLTIFLHRGSYYRLELDTAFFRARQREFGGSYEGQAPGIEPIYLKLFEEMLEIFKENDIKLIVSEFEEAPFIYGSADNRKKWRDFMHDNVEKRVHQFGFPYVRVDFDKLSNTDYFDYNHLNSRGAETFIPMLADQLRPYVPHEDGGAGARKP